MENGDILIQGTHSHSILPTPKRSIHVGFARAKQLLTPLCTGKSPAAALVGFPRDLHGPLQWISMDFPMEFHGKTFFTEHPLNLRGRNMVHCTAAYSPTRWVPADYSDYGWEVHTGKHFSSNARKKLFIIYLYFLLPAHLTATLNAWLHEECEPKAEPDPNNLVGG